MKWNKKDIKYLNEHYTNFGSKYCSEQLNRSQGSTRKKAYCLGLKSFKFNKPTYILEKKCLCCGKNFKIKTKKIKTDYIKKYCSRTCANKKTHKEETKLKIKKSVNNYNIKNGLNKKFIKLNCNWCGNVFEVSIGYKNQKYCNRSCKGKYGASRVKKSNKVTRSKNEIYFAKLCEKHFNNIETNEKLFNGWDADVIIHDIKTAVLWNGKWHYKKITKTHSLKQVQNRDKIKINEIKNYGYEPYIIKDMGSHNKKFVEEKFNEFILRCSQVVRQLSHKE